MAERTSMAATGVGTNGGVVGALAIRAGGALSPLDALVDGVRVIRAGDLVCQARPPEFVVDQMLTAGSVIFLAGDAKVAKKTWTAMELGLRTARGEPFLGFSTHQRRVVYMFYEDGSVRVAWRLKQVGLQDRDPVDLTCVVGRGLLQSIQDAIHREDRPVLLIIDPFVRFGLEAGLEDENNAAAIEDLLQPLRDLAQATNSTILIVHHFRKARDTMRGSVALEGSSDGWINVRALPNGDTVLKWTLRDAEEGEAGIHFVFTGSSVALERAAVPASVEAANELQRDIEDLREFMRAHCERPWSQTKLADQLFCKDRNRARRALTVLEQSQQVWRPRGEKGGYEPTPKLLEDPFDLE